MNRQLLLLGVLLDGKMHGYKLNEYVEHTMGLYTDLKKPTVYYVLEKLEKDGYVQQKTEREGNNVESIFKALQFDPAFSPGFFDIEWQLEDANCGIFTVKNCGPLNSIEKEGKGYEVRICQELEPPAFAATVHYYNPRAKITPLKLPPRESPDDIACKWKITLE